MSSPELHDMRAALPARRPSSARHLLLSDRESASINGNDSSDTEREEGLDLRARLNYSFLFLLR